MPAKLDDMTCSELMRAYISRLLKYPELHDKVEFEIVPTCLDFDFDRHKEHLLSEQVNETTINKLKDALKENTENIVTQNITAFVDGELSIKKLERRRKQIIQSTHESPLSSSLAIDLLLKDCSRFGAVPFANVARHAFIATSFLHSMLVRNILSQQEYEQLLTSLPTVASEATKQIDMVVNGQASIEDFLVKFGHLRPGTYDITVPSYSEDFEKYFGNILRSKRCKKQKHSVLKINEFSEILKPKKKAIRDLIKEVGFNFDEDQLTDFIQRSIPARESFKLEFTKNICQIFTILKDLGKLF